MSVAKKSAIFVLAILAVSWTPLIMAWLDGRRDVLGAGLSSQVFVFTPTLVAILCSVVFERGRRREALGLCFKPNWWWLGALLVPCVLGAISMGLDLAVSSRALPSLSAMIAQLEMLQAGGDIPGFQLPHDADAAAAPFLATFFLLLLVQFILLACVTEEIAWRGYLYHLWRPFGFWRASWAAGLMQGVWHWPMIYLFGLGFPDNRIAGMIHYAVATALMGPIATFLRERGRSYFAASIFHGAMNSFSSVTLVVVAVANAADPQAPSLTNLSITAAVLGAGNLFVFIMQRDRVEPPRR